MLMATGEEVMNKNKLLIDEAGMQMFIKGNLVKWPENTQLAHAL